MSIPIIPEKKRAAVAAGIVAWAQSHGNDARDVRDAAHEATHALESGAKTWGRETIHRKLKAMGRGYMAASEMHARAVERLVCAAVGVTHDWDRFLMLAHIESIKGSGIALPNDFGAMVLAAMERPRVIERAASIVRAGQEFAENPPTPKRARKVRAVSSEVA